MLSRLRQPSPTFANLCQPSTVVDRDLHDGTPMVNPLTGEPYVLRRHPARHGGGEEYVSPSRGWRMMMSRSAQATKLRTRQTYWRRFVDQSFDRSALRNYHARPDRAEVRARAQSTVAVCGRREGGGGVRSGESWTIWWNVVLTVCYPLSTKNVHQPWPWPLNERCARGTHSSRTTAGNTHMNLSPHDISSSVATFWPGGPREQVRRAKQS